MWVDGRGGMLSWLVDGPLEDPVPAGLAWLTRAELDGYYLLYDDAPLLDDTAAARASRGAAARGSGQ